MKKSKVALLGSKGFEDQRNPKKGKKFKITFDSEKASFSSNRREHKVTRKMEIFLRQLRLGKGDLSLKQDSEKTSFSSNRTQKMEIFFKHRIDSVGRVLPRTKVPMIPPLIYRSEWICCSLDMVCD